MYSPISLKKGEFRVLEISPGGRHEQIKASLRHTFMEKPEPYEALSYTWGSPAQRATILVNEQPFLVNSNLYAALFQLRHAQETRNLWIDAICMNQGDEAEKSLHIPMMHLVYTSASVVLVWLGRASEDSDEAMAQLGQFSELENLDEFVAALSESAKANGRARSYNIWRPLTSLFSRPWWSRIWVLQEIVWASRTVGLCGSAQQPWEKFVTMGAFLPYIMELRGSLHQAPRVMPDTVLQEAARATYVEQVNKYAHSRRHSLFTRLDITLERVSRLRLATDPRDKVYGILNLLPLSEWPCTPSYSITAEELFTKVAVHIMRTTGDIKFLATCCATGWPVGDSHLRRPYSLERLALTLDIPSWVPNWNLMPLSCAFRGGIIDMDHNQPHTNNTEAHRAPPIFRLEPSNTLVVRGILLAHVDDLSSNVVMSRPHDLYDTPKTRCFQEFVKAHRHRSELFSFDAQIDDEWELLTCNSRPGESLTYYTKKDYTSWRTIQQPVPPMEFSRLVDRAMVGRRVAAMSSGALGLVPYATAPGDHIAFIVGCHVPMVLRPLPQQEPQSGCREEHPATLLEDDSGNGAGLFQVIGEAYLQGCDVPGLTSLFRDVSEASLDIRLR